MEVYFHGNFYRDWIPIFLRRLKFPGFHGSYGLFIEPASEWRQNVNVRSVA